MSVVFNPANQALALRWPVVDILPRLGDPAALRERRDWLRGVVQRQGRKFTRAEAFYLPQSLPTPLGPLPYGLAYAYQCHSCPFYQRHLSRCQVTGGFRGEEDGFIASTAWCAYWMPDPDSPENRAPLEWLRKELGGN